MLISDIANALPPHLRSYSQAALNSALDFATWVLPSRYTGVFNGIRMTVDLRDKTIARTLLIFRQWEPFQTGLAQRLASGSETVLDVGANIGWYVLALAPVVKRVYAFEPNPVAFSFLETNIRQNGFVNVKPVRKAVSDRSGISKLFFSPSNFSDGALWAQHRDSLEVETTSLDDYFEGSGERISFVKMDIQGVEFHALRGMKRVIEQNRNLRMMTEFWPYGLKKMGVRPVEFLKSLSDAGFALSEIDERKSSLLPVPESRFDEFASMENYANLLCAR